MAMIGRMPHLAIPSTLSLFYPILAFNHPCLIVRTLTVHSDDELPDPTRAGDPREGGICDRLTHSSKKIFKVTFRKFYGFWQARLYTGILW